MKIELITTDSSRVPALEAFVNKHGLLFTSGAWTSLYDGDQLCRCAILNNNNEIIGCFVYYRFKKSIFHFVISPPYTPHIDLFCVNPAESVVGKNTFNKELAEALSLYFSSLKTHYLSLNLPAGLTDTQPFIWAGFNSRTRFTYVIDLQQNETQLWDNLASEKRKSINKAQKDGLEISETHQYDVVYDLVLQSLDRNDKAKNTGILKEILFKYATPSNAFAFLASKDKQPIGATFCLVYQHTALYLFGGFNAANAHHGASVSCMWQSILKAKQMGLRCFDFEGSMNESIERYFREFGGTLTPYFCVEKIHPLMSTYFAIRKNKPV